MSFVGKVVAASHKDGCGERAESSLCHGVIVRHINNIVVSRLTQIYYYYKLHNMQSARTALFHRLRTVVEHRHKIIIHIIQLLLSVIALFIVEKICVKILNFRIKIFQLCYFVHFIQFSDDDSLLTKQIRRAMSAWVWPVGVCVCAVYKFSADVVWHSLAQPAMGGIKTQNRTESTHRSTRRQCLNKVERKRMNADRWNHNLHRKFDCKIELTVQRYLRASVSAVGK